MFEEKSILIDDSNRTCTSSDEGDRIKDISHTMNGQRT